MEYYSGVPSSWLGRGQKSEVWKGLGEERWTEKGEESVKKQKRRGERERGGGRDGRKEREIKGGGDLYFNSKILFTRILL